MAFKGKHRVSIDSKRVAHDDPHLQAVKDLASKLDFAKHVALETLEAGRGVDYAKFWFKDYPVACRIQLTGAGFFLNSMCYACGGSISIVAGAKQWHCQKCSSPVVQRLSSVADVGREKRTEEKVRATLTACGTQNPLVAQIDASEFVMFLEEWHKSFYIAFPDL